MKYLKRTLRISALIVFMLLAAAGIGIFGIAPTLTKNRKLFADIEAVSEIVDGTNEVDRESMKTGQKK